MKATIGISKENRNGIWEHWNKAIDEEQYNKITEIVRENEDYYDFKEDYKAWEEKMVIEIRYKKRNYLIFEGESLNRFYNMLKCIGTDGFIDFLKTAEKDLHEKGE